MQAVLQRLAQHCVQHQWAEQLSGRLPRPELNGRGYRVLRVSRPPAPGVPHPSTPGGHLLKEQVAEGLGKLAVLHQQEVPQGLEVGLKAQLHEEVVHHGLVHQGDAGGRGPESGVRGATGWAGMRAWDPGRHSLGGQRGRDRVLHEHRQRQQLAQRHHCLIRIRLSPGVLGEGEGLWEPVVEEAGDGRLRCTTRWPRSHLGDTPARPPPTYHGRPTHTWPRSCLGTAPGGTGPPGPPGRPPLGPGPPRPPPPPGLGCSGWLRFPETAQCRCPPSASRRAGRWPRGPGPAGQNLTTPAPPAGCPLTWDLEGQRGERSSLSPSLPGPERHQ